MGVEKEKKKRSPSYSRTKGNQAEQDYARRFKDLGYEYCKTSRLASRLLDFSGIDLSGIPFNVQIKCGFKRNRPNAEALFKKMKADLLINFSPDEPVHSYPKLLIHKAHGYNPEGELVTMTWNDFLTFLNAFKRLKIEKDV